MKVFTYLACAVVSGITLCSCERNEAKLAGTINGGDGKTVTLMQMSADSTFTVDSAKVAQGGRVLLHAPLTKEPTFYKALVDGRQIIFVADSAQTINVRADLTAADWYKSIEFDNSPENDLLAKVIGKGQTLQSLLQSYKDRVATMTPQEQLTESEKAQSQINVYREQIKELVFANPKSFASYYAIYQYIMDLPAFDIYNQQDHTLFGTVATSLSLAHPNSARVKRLCDDVLQARIELKRREKMQKLLNEATTAKIPEIVMKDKNGEEHRLSELSGKTVILYFWHSTDRQSRQLNLQLATLRTRHKNLEVFAVSLDTSRLLWEDAMQKDGVDWVSVCDLTGSACLAARTYNVQQLPTNFIINPQGDLVGKDLFGRRLDEKMAEMMK